MSDIFSSIAFIIQTIDFMAHSDVACVTYTVYLYTDSRVTCNADTGFHVTCWGEPERAPH